METNYLVVDMGTGNSRVGLVSADGTIVGNSKLRKSILQR